MSMASGSAGHTPGAEASRKLLAVLMAFSEARPVRSVPELAAEAGVPTSSAYRYVAVLREVGLLDSAGGGGYRLTDRIVTLARAAEAARASLVDVAHPYLEALRDEVDETVVLVRRGGRAVYCIDRAESTRPVRLQFDVGQAMPAHSGSSSRVLLASAPRSERDAYVAEVLDGLPANRKALLAEHALDAVAAAGWTESFEEVDDGIWGVAAAVKRESDVVAALGVAGPIYRIDASRRARICEATRHAAAQISAALAKR
jgi:DNA-binding IclR family transcriptional regulator